MRLPSRAGAALAVLAASALAVPALADAWGAARDQAGPSGAEPAATQEAARPRQVGRESWDPGLDTRGRHAFTWTRAIYTGGRRGWWRDGPGAWATDFPKGDLQFLVVLRRLVRLDAAPWENAVGLGDPELRRYPMVYAVEVGHMDLTPEEIHGLRGYLNAGGLLVVDDFWGTREWDQFERNMRLVLPGRPIVELPSDHPVFTTYYRIDEVKQVPARGRGVRGRPTWEQDGYVPHVRGILDDRGELMVLIHWNTDLGDAWEWAEDPHYPLEYSTYAFEMGANMVVYGMSR